MGRVLAGVAAAVLILAGSGGASDGRVAPAVEFSPAHQGRHNAVVRVVTDQRLVALTFDDGPSARYTPRVLGILRRARARATFFVVGRAVLRQPGIVRDAVQAGHEVGDHTFTHARLTPLAPARIAWELRAGARAIERAGVPAPAYSRPPWGWFDERVAAIADTQKRPLIGWNLSLESTLREHGLAGLPALVARVRPGSIILAHDARGMREQTLAALPVFLRLLRARGFHSVTISALMQAARPRSTPR